MRSTYDTILYVNYTDMPFLEKVFKVPGRKNATNSWFRLVICSKECTHLDYPVFSGDSKLKELVGPRGVRLQSPYNLYYRFALDVFKFLNSTDLSGKKFHFEFGGHPRGHYYLIRLLIWTNLSGTQFCDFKEIKFEENNSNYLINHMDRFVLESISKWDLNDNYPNRIFCCAQAGCPASKRPEMIFSSNNFMDIVVPTKNVPLFEVLRCLESINRQIVAGDQIYLVDDNDYAQLDLLDIANGSNHIHLIRGDNCGVASARNKGLNAGKNSIVSFVDSDDYLLPGYFEIQRNFHINNPAIAATGTWLQSFGSVSTIYPQWDGINPLGLLMCLPPAGVLTWKRSVLSENRFDLTFGDGFEDFDLVARVIAKNYPIAVFDFPLYMYQRGHVSLSQSWSRSIEHELRSKVNSNVNLLCRHKLEDLFSLLSEYGKRLLVSHPDLVFRVNSRDFKKYNSLHLISYLRKSKVLRKMWRTLPEEIRFRLFRKLTRD